jgi:hypothetical protein
MVLVQHLAPSEKHCKLDLMAFFNELTGMFLLDLKIVRVCLRSQPYFLQCCRMLGMLLVCFTQLAFLLVLPLAIVHDATDRRIACRSNLDKIQSRLARPGESITRLNNSDLIVCFIDESD